MPDHTSPDFYNIDSLLSEDERQVRDMVARFVDERVLPGVADCFEHERFPTELVKELAELGLLGPTFSEYGCAGLNNVCYGLIMQELERGDSGLRSFASVQSGLVMYPIHRYGSDEQKKDWLPRLARGDAIGCFGLTEPDGGSDPGVMKTVASRSGDDWVINGAKMWITNGSVADVAVVWADTPEGIRGFLSKRTRRAIPRATSSTSSPCARRSPASSSLTTAKCPPAPCYRRRRVCRGR